MDAFNHNVSIKLCLSITLIFNSILLSFGYATVDIVLLSMLATFGNIYYLIKIKFNKNYDFLDEIKAHFASIVVDVIIFNIMIASALLFKNNVYTTLTILEFLSLNYDGIINLDTTRQLIDLSISEAKKQRAHNLVQDLLKEQRDMKI